MPEHILILDDKQLQVLKAILETELYDQLNDDEIPVWKEIERKTNALK